MKYKKDTSHIILNAAFEEFEEKGYNGARMQSIANKAGINKALLHYYYKSKDAMFKIIIDKAFHLLMPKVISIFEEDSDFFETIEKFVSTYINILVKNPYIPGFVTQEINNNPKRLLNLVKSPGINLNPVKEKIAKAVEDGIIENINPNQLIINIMSLCIFPFVGRPLIEGVLLNGDKDKFDQLIEQRKNEVSKFIIKAIKK